jgi:drug/metabolite transporter (DMT)-like permease
MKALDRSRGIWAASLSAIAMGVIPIFGKQALGGGFTPLAVVSLRTTIAAVLLCALMLIFKRQFFYIYPVGLVGCILAGIINGIGSIFYYTALSRLDASIGHLLYSFYPILMALWLWLDRQPVRPLTAIRLLLCIPGIILLVATGAHQVDSLGAIFMLISAALYAFHLLINQRVLYEVPAPTVTLYTLLSMSLTVTVAFVVFKPTLPPINPLWGSVFAMALFTFISRITLFLGVKHLGGIQTAMLGLGELFVTVLLAQVVLGEHLGIFQWIGALILAVSILLIGYEKKGPEPALAAGWFSWLNPVNPFHRKEP